MEVFRAVLLAVFLVVFLAVFLVLLPALFLVLLPVLFFATRFAVFLFFRGVRAAAAFARALPAAPFRGVRTVFLADFFFRRVVAIVWLLWLDFRHYTRFAAFFNARRTASHMKRAGRFVSPGS